jgi:3-hydroxybutyryl-CoA dehydratase
MKNFTIDQLRLGQKAHFTKTVSEADVYLFAGLTGDMNPVHVNKEYAEKTLFGERIAHGILTAGLISTAIGMYLPGPGTINMGQTLRFLKPVKFGDTITAEVEVIEIITEKNKVVLRTLCKNQKGEVVLDGETQAKAPTVNVDV